MVRQSQLQFSQYLTLDDPDWQQLCQTLKTSTTLAAIVLSAWKMGLWLAKVIAEQQLQERAEAPVAWGTCSMCRTQLVSKGFVSRQMLNLIGVVRWKRRIGRCPHKYPGSQHSPFDMALGIQSYQQTSTELMRLGCLLAVFLPFDLTAQLLLQLTGITISDATIWNWVQTIGQQAVTHLKLQLQNLADGQSPQVAVLDAIVKAMPLIIAADGVISS